MEHKKHEPTKLDLFIKHTIIKIKDGLDFFNNDNVQFYIDTITFNVMMDTFGNVENDFNNPKHQISFSLTTKRSEEKKDGAK